jgi:uncharacterized membrane protein YfcA
LIIFSDPHESIIISTTLALIVGANLLIKTWKDIALKMVKKIFIFNLLGLPLGLFVFLTFNIDNLKVLIGIFIVFFGLLLLLNWNYKIKNENVAEPCVGLLTGFFQGSIGLPGIPLAIYITLQDFQKKYFRGTINVILCLSGLIGLVLFWSFSQVHKDAYLKGILFAPVGIIGLNTGFKVSNRVSQKLFRKIVNFIIIGSGAYNLFQFVFK